MALLCFVWCQPRLLKISYLPLMLASLEEIDYLLLDTGSVWAKVRIAIAASFAEIQHVAGVSLPSQPAPALASLTPLCKLTSRLGHGFKSCTWEPATRQMSCDPPFTPAFTPSKDTRMLRELPEPPEPATLPGLSCNPSTSRGKVRCFFTRGHSQERRKLHVGTLSLLDTNKWGQLSQSK